MKRVISIICVAVLLISLCSLTACKDKKEELHATYKLVEVSMGKTSIPLENLGYENAMLKFDGDTATMSDFNGMTSTLKVNAEEQTLEDSTSTLSYTIDGKTLTMEGDGLVMVFEEQED